MIDECDLTQRPVQFRGSALAQVVLRLLGWQVRFDGLPSKQGVMIVYPHTSNWDFVIGIIVKWAVGIDFKFWAKASLFEVPLLGAWLRGRGGIPVDRSASHGVVGEMVRQIEQARQEQRLFWLAITPEGTRRHTEGWRFGFYAVTYQAQVPLGLTYIDYAEKVLAADKFILLSGSQPQDLEVIKEHFAKVRGLRHEQASPIRLL